MSVCSNCGTILEGKFCHVCGQDCRSEMPGLLQFLRDSFSDYFDVDSRALRSLKDLFFPPGAMTAAYLAGKRQKYLPPFSLFFAVSITFLFALSHVPGYAIHLDWYGVSITTLTTPNVSITAGTLLPEMVREQVFSLGERAMDMRDFNVFEHGGGAILTLVILGTLLLKAFVPKKKTLEHLVFSLHLYTGSLIVLSPGIVPLRSSLLHDIVNFFLNGIVLFFLFLMHRRVYQTTPTRTFLFLLSFTMINAVSMIGIAVYTARSSFPKI